MKLGFSSIHRADVEFQSNCICPQNVITGCAIKEVTLQRHDLFLHHHKLLIRHSIVNTGKCWTCMI